MKKLLKNKKIIIIAAIIIVFTIIFVIILPTDEKPLQQSSLPPVNPSQSADALDSASITTIPTYPYGFPIEDGTMPAVPDNWLTGDNTAYTIKFPPDWQPTITRVVGNGTKVVIMRPSDHYYPVFVIEAEPTNPANPIEKRIEVLKEFIPQNYSESTITFRGQPARLISEILPIEDKEGNPLDKNYLFFTKENTTYVATFAFIQDKYADVNRQTLIQILNSIKLK